MSEQQPERYDAVVAINVDIQNDFCPGGALAVSDGDAVVPVMNQVNEWVRSQKVERKFDHVPNVAPEQRGRVIFTADWHPANSKHFDVNGGPWPVHCVKHKGGAAFHDDLDVKPDDTIARKGQRPEDDGYSGWHASINNGPLYRPGFGPHDVSIDNVQWAMIDVAKIFNARGNYSERPRRVALLIGGLATDYCVKATVLDALNEQQKFPQFAKQLGIYVVEDAIRAVDLNPGDGDKAIAEMKAAGATFVKSEDVIAGKVIEVRGQS